MTPLKLSFIGYGRHAQANLYPCLKILGYQLSSIATTSPESSQKAAADYNISRYFTNHQELLTQDTPDAAFVCVQPQQQFQVVKDTLLAGVHVFSEKPLGLTLNEAKEIERISETTGKHVMVGYMKRFSPAHKKLKQVMDTPTFGQPLAITQLFTSRNFAKNATEYLLFAAIHYIDLMRWYLGDIERISGNELTNDEASLLSFSLKFKNGAIGSVQYAGTPSWERATHEMTITSENGYARINGIDRVVSYIKNTNLTIPRWQVLEETEQSFGTMLTTGIGGLQPLYLNGFVGEIKHFVESLEQGKVPQCSAKENVKTMEIVTSMIDALA